MTGFALAFPGQGVKPADLRRDLADLRSEPLISVVLESLHRTDVADLDLTDTRVVQPTMLALGLIRARAIAPSLANVPLVAGHSFGEITALAFAGAVSEDDAIRLARTRGELCQRTSAERPGAMVAVMGLDATEVEWMRRRISFTRPTAHLEVAAINGPKQIVLSGDPDAVRQVAEDAAAVDAEAQVLPIGGAFHCQHMAGALPEWTAALDAIEIRPPNCTFVSSTEARPLTTARGVRRALARALVLPVRWVETLSVARELGVRRMVDAGPGQVLHKLGKRLGGLDFVEYHTVIEQTATSKGA
ncbi:ACP S-malonyltransferase [Nocardia brasiliensis]|uniref:ACP S-malonyltransferase n=1 Tax=Nocardia brasiliensis TaxID=37326 RepID=UPI0036729020